jgi:hypothetical protein
MRAPDDSTLTQPIAPRSVHFVAAFCKPLRLYAVTPSSVFNDQAAKSLKRQACAFSHSAGALPADPKPSAKTSQSKTP